eukprot:UN03431
MFWFIGQYVIKSQLDQVNRGSRSNLVIHEWNRIQDIEKMYKKNALNTFENLFAILNQEYDGYVRFSKKEWEMEYPP